MHRAQSGRKNIKKEGHNSLCPYKIIKILGVYFPICPTELEGKDEKGKIDSHFHGNDKCRGSDLSNPLKKENY